MSRIGRYHEHRQRPIQMEQWRINFKNTWSSAMNDRKVFEAYLLGKLSIEGACQRVAKNNDLAEVTPFQFEENFKLSGYAGASTRSK